MITFPNSKICEVFFGVALHLSMFYAMRLPGPQADCGSCWAFGSVEAMTDRLCIATKGQKKIHLSAEDVTSCDTLGDMGCNGGIPSTVPGIFFGVRLLMKFLERFVISKEFPILKKTWVFHPERRGMCFNGFQKVAQLARCTPTTRPSELWMAATTVTNPCAIPIS